MSRIAKNPIPLPTNVAVSRVGFKLTVKGNNGLLEYDIHPRVHVEFDSGYIRVFPDKKNKIINALAGTTRAIINNMVIGVTDGYVIKLLLVGVGYRAQGKGNLLTLSIGFSHPIEFEVPNGITIESPTQTEILIKGCDKQIVGQVAANIRAYRPPEPYKGKGIRYSDEVITRKEAKKK
jgi:large subunit ribosomal protein L6